MLSIIHALYKIGKYLNGLYPEKYTETPFLSFTISFHIVYNCVMRRSKAPIMMITESRRSRKPPLSKKSLFSTSLLFNPFLEKDAA